MDIGKIKEKIKELIPHLRSQYGISTIGIFGSYVRGEQKKGSDLDILVEFDESGGPSLFKFIEMENYISDCLGVRVDLVEKSSLKPRIGKNILEQVVML